MSFWESAENAMNKFGDAMQRKQEEVIRTLRRQIREKTDEELLNGERNAEMKGNWTVLELIQEELNRRGY